MFLLLYGSSVDHMLQGLYLCISKEIGVSVVSCFIMIPVLLYHVFNCSSAWFHLWAIYMRVLCTSLLYNNLFVHMRFFVTCSSTWYVWAYRQLWFLIFSALVLFLQLSWWPSALWTVHTCSNYFNRWRLMDLLVEVLSYVCFALLIYFSVNWQELNVKCVVNTFFVFLTMENNFIKICLVPSSCVIDSVYSAFKF